MICYYRLINGSKQHINPSNEQKVRQERHGSAMFVVVQNDVHEADHRTTI